ncbi:MAG: hypothetical protein F6J92_40360 [Symploca sp. SIO1A3]|nr:hypothetical protein [Symploca sp. SIO1A3]
MANYSRKLAPFEEEFELYQTEVEGAGLVACLMRVRGSLEIRVIKQSLSLLQQHHPYLQMHIVKNTDGMYFEAKEASEIPLRIIERNKENQWLEVIEEELNHKIDSRQGPLIKSAYIPAAIGSDIFDLIFTIHHSISDGASLIQLCREFLDYCARITEGEQLKVERLPMTPPVEQLLPRSKTALQFGIFLFILKFILNQLLKKPRQLSYDIYCPVSEQKVRLINLCLNEKQTKQLCKLCNQERTTVTGALNAAMLLTFKNELAIAGNVYINAAIAVNLRQFIQSEFAQQHHLGLMAGSIFMTEFISNNSSFWEIARNSRQKIEQGLQSHQHFYAPLAARDRIGSFKKGRILPLAYILSNMGQINQGANYGSLELIENHITASSRSYNPSFVLHCTTFRSRLYLNFSYNEPLISAKRAQSLADFFMSAIDQAIV